MVDSFRTRMQARAVGCLPFVVALASHATAQSFDCSKAKPPIETAICASSDLRARDNALAGVYARALYGARDDSAALDLLKQAQRQWIAARNRDCAHASDKIESCLSAAYAARMVELGNAGVAQPANAQAQPAPQSAQPAAQVAQPAAQVAQPAGVAPAQPTSIAAPSGRVEPASVLADREASALVTIPNPGRYALRAKSATGVAIQLVDMLAGPGDVAGAAGARDGRLDVLLDKGVYKLRTTGAKGAKDPAALSAEPFRNVAAPADLAADQPAGGELGDLQQRSFWLNVDSSGRVAIEAVGRALQDLRLWRDGEELADLVPDVATVEAKAGRPMSRYRLEGKVEPGRYLVTAYGGESAVWADGAADKPFMIRQMSARSLAAGVAEDAIGAFGSLRFEAPADFDSFRLELAEPAPVRMTVRRGGEIRLAVIARNSRDPFVNATLAARDKTPAIVEISGLEGQAFRLRGLRASSDLRIAGAGPTTVTVSVAGEGGDEIPATALLVRFEQNKARVIAADAPRVGPGQAWRRRFNLRGPSTILFETTGAGPVAIRTQGPVVRAVIEPVLGSTAPRADGRAPGRYDLEAGVYLLRLTPVNGAAGVIDLTLGQPGLLPEPPTPPAPRSAISLGVQQIERGVSYEAIANSAPGLLVGLAAAPSPVDLARGPFGVWQGLPRPSAASLPTPAPAPQRQGAAPTQPNARPAVHRQAERRPPTQPAAARPSTPRPPIQQAQAPQTAPRPAESSTGEIVLQARAPLGGAIRVRDQRGADVAVSLSDEKAEKDFRSFTLRIPASSGPRALEIAWVAPVQPTPPAKARQPLQTIAAGQPFHFDLADGQRREFRIEAKDGGLYRVETLGRLKTRVAIGTNFKPRLGEGDDNGAGHNGLVQTYLRAGSYRVAVSAKDSSGRLGLTATPADMAVAGTLSPGGSVRATLADGRGAVAPIDIREPGLYRLQLYSLDRDLSARLEDSEGWPLTAPGPLSRLEIRLEPGKYRLVLPPVAVDARVVARLDAVRPEASLEGHGPHPLPFGAAQKLQWREPQAKDAPRAPDVWTFVLKGESRADLKIGDGMIGELFRGEKESVGKFTKDRPFAGKLAAGAYRVEARALGRDDRLDYDIALSTDELQPDSPRFADLPAKLDFAIATDRVVNLTSFGRKDLKGALRDANGAIVERLGGRAHDWNIALSRRLAAGRYTLTLSAMKAEADSSDQAPAEASEEAELDADQRAKLVEVRLALPDEADEPALKADGAATVAGPQVHRFALPEAPAGALALVAARSAAELVLSIETRDGPDAAWRVAGFERGEAPLIAWPAGAAKAQWRASVWSIDGASAPIALVARAVTRQPQASDAVTLEPLALDAVGLAPRIGLARASSAAIVDMKTASDALYAGSADGRVLTRADVGALAPQTERLWLVARDAATDKVSAPALAWTGEKIALALDAGESAVLPAPQPPAGKARIWRARSAFGQPGLDSGRGMAVGEATAVALAGGKPLRVWNAGGAEALRIDLDSIDVAVAPKRAGGSEIAALLPPLTALPATLSSGDKRLDIDLAAGTAAFAAPTESEAFAVAAANEATSRTSASSASEIWLVNLTDKPKPVRLAASAAKFDGLGADRIVKRFFGAAGSTALRVDAQKGDVLRVEGAEATFVSKSGAVLRGGTLTLDGPGEVALAYQPGLVAAWLERAGASAWPKAQAKALAAPASIKLDGAAMAFALKPDQPSLIGVTTSAPVVVALEQGGRREMKLYASGADFRRYVAAGDATLTVWSPHDGALGGALDLTASPVTPAKEGLGEPVALAPGASALFGFEVKRASEIGVGLRAEPDRAEARLLDALGKPIGEGVAQIKKLQPGRYILEARMPVDAPAGTVRPALIGLDPPPAGPPAEEVEKYLAAAGLKTNSKSQ